MRKLAIVLGCLLYVICPIDFVPDFIPLAGQADDLVAIVLGVMSLLRENDSWRRW